MNDSRKSTSDTQKLLTEATVQEIQKYALVSIWWD